MIIRKLPNVRASSILSLATGEFPFVSYLGLLVALYHPLYIIILTNHFRIERYHRSIFIVIIIIVFIKYRSK